MPPRKTASSATKTTPKAGALGFGASKKSTAQAAAKKTSAREATPTDAKPTRPESNLTGLYPRLYKEALRKMGTPAHREEMDDVEIILRVFDATEEFGPCSRTSRLERFERAERLGLKPDPQIGEILRSEDGQTRSQYRDSVFNV
ncbi:hypothetical protein JCM10207_004511 [Rhodosporidiobolus poonsookiae]